MAEWKARPSGLLVPAVPQHNAPMSSVPAGWASPTPERRIFTRPGVGPAEPAGGSWSIRDLHIQPGNSPLMDSLPSLL